MRGAYLGSMFMVTTARPLSRFTPWTLPILTPERSTVCPCPGVTAWDELNSAFSSKWLWPRIGSQDGKLACCLTRITLVVTIASTARTPMAMKSRRCSRIARFT